MAGSPHSDRLPHFLGVLLVDAGDRIDARLERAAGSGGAAPAALVALDTWPDRSIDFLAGVLGRSHSGTVRLVDRLVAGGLVSRSVADDARALRLRLTTAGARRAEAIRAERARVLEELAAPLSGPERRALAAGLMKILGHPERTRTEARHACRLCDHRLCRDDACPVGRSVPSPDPPGAPS